MDTKTILTQAISKAMSNGWKPKLETGSETDKERYALSGKLRVNDFIYDHDFAKALWGDIPVEQYYDDGDEKHPFMGGSISYPYNEGSSIQFVCHAWKYHLQQMVIADNPIQYLKDNMGVN